MMVKKWFFKEENIIKIIISISAILLVVYKIIDKDNLIDSVVLGLFCAAILPWASSFLADASMPGGWKFSFREIEKSVEDQDKIIKKQKEQINQQRKIIDDLVIFSMAWFLFDLLKAIHNAKKDGKEFLFKKHDHAENLLWLRNNGYIEIQGIRQLNENVNLANVVELSPIGNSYVEIRESREKELQENNTTTAH